MKLGLQLNSFDWVVARYADACSLRPGPQVPDKLKPLETSAHEVVPEIAGL